MTETRNPMPNRSFKSYVDQELGKFASFVIYALLEWLLILLLFFDAFLSFACTEFARFFDMRIPCLLCTRIDHLLTRRSRNFYYNDSVCDTHKKDVSSLAFCHMHKRLSDIRKMCEGCLLSFATEKESDCYTYKSLIGILHKDLDCFVQDDYSQIQIPLPKKEEVTNSCFFDGGDRCSCCGEPLRMVMRPRGMNTTSKSGRGTSPPFSQAPAPSPRAFMGPRNGDIPSFVMHRQMELKLMDADSYLTPDESGLGGGSGSGLGSGSGGEFVKCASMSSLAEAEDITDTLRTPTFAQRNKFFGIPLCDGGSPRWAGRSLRKSPLEKTEFASDTPPENNNESDYSILSHLKRQVRLDRKSLMALYMELDEERSASAVAANNAMAMITRLQAEKAAVQMEALQYQRMMEEQSEYDQEALQEMHDLLMKREEDVKSLETELDIYRKKHGCLKEEDFESYKEEAPAEEEKFEDLPQQLLQNNPDQEEQEDTSAKEAARPAERMRTLRKVGGFRQKDGTRNRSAGVGDPDSSNIIKAPTPSSP